MAALHIVRPDERPTRRCAPSATIPGWTPCGLPPSSRLDGKDTPPLWTCRRCLALLAATGTEATT